MMWLTPALAQMLQRLAREGAPQEVCGLLIGHGEDVVEVIPVSNAADDPKTEYRLDEREYIQALFSAEKRGLELVGFYHSHPLGVAIPSQMDVRQSAYPEALNLIVGLAGEPLMSVWKLAYERVEHVEMVISAVPPRREPAGRVGVLVVLSALVAVLIMIVLSLVLLPPAPPLPAP